MKLYYESLGNPPLGLRLVDVPGRLLAQARADGMEGYRTWANQADQLSLITSRDSPAGKLHASIAHPSRYPTWDEILAVRDWFFMDETEAVMVLARKSEYVNAHNFCFHIHESMCGREGT